MKKNLFRAVALVLVIAASSGCVNNDYDLKTLDPSLTILPGLKIHVSKSEGEKSVIKNSSFLTKSSSVTELSNNNLAISGGKKSSKNLTFTYKEGSEIVFDSPLCISTASWLNELLPGAILNAPLIPVIEVTNPTDITMNLYGKAICGEKTVDFGPYSVHGGTTYVKLEKESIIDFFLPIVNDVEITDLKLVWHDNSKAPKSKDAFSIQAYAPLTFNPGDKIFLEYPCAEDFLTKIDLQEKAEKHHISVESLSVDVDLVNSFPLDLNIYASGELDNGPASASISSTIAAGSLEAPVSSSVIIKAQLAKGAHSFKNATVCVEGKVSGDRPVAITPEQNLNYSVVTITLDSGITLGL